MKTKLENIKMSDFELKPAEIEENVKMLVEQCHGLAYSMGWYTDLNTGEDMRGKRNVGELLCLVHSEVSEAMEGHRKGLMDDKLPEFDMLTVELADAIIRICDMAGSMDLPLGNALARKMIFNRSRADHKLEHRKAKGGKKF